MKKMLNPKKKTFWDTSKITDHDEEEFPLFTEETSMMANSEMRSLMSGRNTIIAYNNTDLGRNKVVTNIPIHKLNKSLDINNQAFIKPMFDMT